MADDAYGNFASGSDLRCGYADATPAWRSALAAWQWTELTTADISEVGPAFNPGAGLVGAARVGRVDAWNGMAAYGASVVMAGVGGHTDWGGNEGYRCNLGAASPVWEMLNTPTPEAQMSIDVTHYGDGRPTSSHTYYGLWASVSRTRLFRFGLGSAYGSGNFQRQNVDAFSLVSNDWDAASTWPEVPESLVYGKAQCQDPTTGNVYVVGNTRLWRFNMSAGTWTQLALIPNNGTAAYYRASIFDTSRNQIVVLGDAYATPAGIMIYSVAGDSWSTATLTGTYASTVAAESGGQAHYSATDDRIYYFGGSGAQVIEVSPSTWATSLRSTTGGTPPNPIHGVFQKAVHVPALGGYAYQPRGDSNLWFLASE